MVKIVIVEDETSIQELLTMAFTKAGYKVYSEFNGKDGLAEIRRLRPDVVLLDVGLYLGPPPDSPLDELGNRGGEASLAGLLTPKLESYEKLPVALETSFRSLHCMFHRPADGRSVVQLTGCSALKLESF